MHKVKVVIALSGNCVLLKPSEVSENTAALLEKIMPKYFDNVCLNFDLEVTICIVIIK